MNHILEEYLCMSGSWYGSLYSDLPVGNNPVDTPEEMCYHDWVDYKGFTEDYKYCLKCDAKHWGKHPAYVGSKKKETKDE